MVVTKSNQSPHANGWRWSDSLKLLPAHPPICLRLAPFSILLLYSCDNTSRILPSRTAASYRATKPYLARGPLATGPIRVESRTKEV